MKSDRERRQGRGGSSFRSSLFIVDHPRSRLDHRPRRQRAISRDRYHARMPCNLHALRMTTVDGVTYLLATCRTEDVNKEN